MLIVHLQLTAFSLQIWYLEGFFLISFLKIFIYLVVLGLSCAHGIFLVLACEILNKQHVGSSSLPRDRTQVPALGT